MARKDFYNLSEDERKAVLARLFGENYSKQEDYGDTIAACGYCNNEVVEVCFYNSTIYINKRTNVDKRCKRWINSIANKVLQTKQQDYFKQDTARVNDYAIAVVDREGYNLCVIDYFWKQKESAA